MPRSCHRVYVCCTSLVLIDRVVFLTERARTYRQTRTVTDATDYPNHASAAAPPAWVTMKVATFTEHVRACYVIVRPLSTVEYTSVARSDYLINLIHDRVYFTLGRFPVEANSVVVIIGVSLAGCVQLKRQQASREPESELRRVNLL